ncbi:MAG: hypothetical protein KAI95_14980, partial [Bacteroidales bacterium]|nr:hypothetical protein [Bacteroidales bacterium]
MKNTLSWKIHWVIIFIFCILSTHLFAENIYVSSLSEFNKAQNIILSGDTITWKNGIYKNADILVYCNGIRVLAEELGKAVFTGSSKCDIAGDNIIFSGFQFMKGKVQADVLTLSGDHNLVTQVNISDYTSNYYVNIKVGSRYNVGTYSNFENKPRAASGKEGTSIFQIQASPSSIGYHKVSYCSFLNHTAPAGAGGDYGMEAIRIGYSYQCQNISRSIVEYCYFYKCNGDGEIISNKARENVFRYNTFADNGQSHFTQRHGDAAYIYGNFFLNGMGVRIKEGQGHAVFNNYFNTGTYTAINLQNHKADPPDSILIAFNTFVNSGPVLLGGSGSYKPAHVTIANNIFKGGSSGIFDDPTGTESWLGNIAFGNLGIKVLEGISLDDPGLISNPEGFFAPSDGSPAIDAAKEGYPTIPDI